MFAPACVRLDALVPYLLESLVDRAFMLRRMAASCLRQLCQRDADEVIRIADEYATPNKTDNTASSTSASSSKQSSATATSGGIVATVIGERAGGLESLLVKLLDIESDCSLVADLHDILNSLLASSLDDYSLRHWLTLCKDVAIGADGECSSRQLQNHQKKRRLSSAIKYLIVVFFFFQTESSAASSMNKQVVDSKKAPAARQVSATAAADEDADADDLDDDSETLAGAASGKSGGGGGAAGHSGLGTALQSAFGSGGPIDPRWLSLTMRQVTCVSSPRWPNRLLALQLIRHIMCLCSSPSHFDASLATKKQPLLHATAAAAIVENEQQTAATTSTTTTKSKQRSYLITFLGELMRVACMGATSNFELLRLAGLDLLHDLIFHFGEVEEAGAEFAGHLLLEQYQAQVSAALRPQFVANNNNNNNSGNSSTSETAVTAYVTAKACQVCSMWIVSGVRTGARRNIGDVRRVHQLLATSLHKLTQCGLAVAGDEQLVHSQLALTIHNLAVLRAWADIYTVAMKNNETKLK